nr:hypothetical protein [Panacagrimonas sp.]
MRKHFFRARMAVPALFLGSIWLGLHGCGVENTCAYGSAGSRSMGCKARPVPTPEEIAATRDGSAFARGLQAFQRSPDANRRLLGVGLNEWGEVSVAIPTGETGFGAARARHVFFDAQGRPITERSRGGTLTQLTGNVEFLPDAVRPQVLRETMDRIGTGDRFLRAEFQGTFGNAGVGWSLAYAAPSGGGNGAMYAMAADGSGLCRLNEGPRPEGVPACNLAALPATRDGTSAATPPPTPAQLEAQAATNAQMKQNLDQLACVQQAQGDVQKLQACVR